MFTTLTETEGEATLTTPAVLPRRDSMSSFCCCLMLSMERTCSIAAVSSLLIGRPMTTGEIDLVASEAGVLTSVLIGCEMPLIVTRRFLLGDTFADEDWGAGAAAWPGWAWEECESWAEEGGLWDVGDSSSSYSASSFMRMLLGERRSLESVVKVKRTKGGEEDDRRGARTVNRHCYRHPVQGYLDGSVSWKSEAGGHAWRDDGRLGWRVTGR